MHMFLILCLCLWQNKQVRLIAEWRDLLSKVSDQQALLASLRDSPYFAPF